MLDKIDCVYATPCDCTCLGGIIINQLICWFAFVQDFNSADDVSSSSGDTMDPNWLNDLLFDDPTILNDRMISDALEPHVVHGEHSYSIDNSNIKMETVVIKDEPIDKGRIWGHAFFG